MGYSDRRRKQARRKPYKKPLPKILVVCEGRITEPQYFMGLKTALQNPRVDVEIGKQHGVPLTLVQYARDIRKQALRRAKAAGDSYLAYNSVWCVFDVDEHPRIPEACDYARNSNIDCAISNPSFELWLLLHFRDAPGALHRDKVTGMLREFDVEYNKHIEVKKYLGGCGNAIARAERLEQLMEETGTPFEESNPSTSVHHLAKLIRSGSAK